MSTITQYWGLIIAVLIGIIFTLLHFQLVYAYARKRAYLLMIAVEKRAEDLLLTTGQQKMDWVVDKGYDLLPSPVRIVISKPLFRIIVQKIFDEAIKLAKQHQIDVVKETTTDPIQEETAAV